MATSKQRLAPYWHAKNSTLITTVLTRNPTIQLGSALAALLGTTVPRGSLCTIPPLVFYALSGTTPAGIAFTLEDLTECGLRVLCNQPRSWPLNTDRAKKVGVVGTKCWFTYHNMPCIVHLDPDTNTLTLCLTDDD
jgi:hypothetical protein